MVNEKLLHEPRDELRRLWRFLDVPHVELPDWSAGAVRANIEAVCVVSSDCAAV